MDSIPSSLADFHSSLGYEKPSKKQEDLDNEFRVSLDLPGVKAADLNISMEQGVLNISGFRRILSRDGETTKRNRFSYSVAVEEDTDVSKLCANLSDGVLVITAPKKARPGPVTIPITTEPHEVFVKKMLEKEHKKTIEAEGSKKIEVSVNGKSDNAEKKKD